MEFSEILITERLTSSLTIHFCLTSKLCCDFSSVPPPFSWSGRTSPKEVARLQPNASVGVTVQNVKIHGGDLFPVVTLPSFHHGFLFLFALTPPPPSDFFQASGTLSCTSWPSRPADAAKISGVS